MTAFQVVYRRPSNVLMAATAFVTMAAFYLWSSQVLVISSHGIAIIVQLQFVAAGLIMALLFGLLVPLLVYAARLSAASRAQTGGTAAGALFGTASMTCCAPVLLPALLSLLGFSGATVLGFNEMLNRFWLPLATAGIILLIYSLVSISQSLNLVCTVSSAGSGDTSRTVRHRKEKIPVR